MDRSKRSEKEEFWRLIIAEQQSSGLSARAFCKREGISESMFYGWRSKISARDNSQPEAEKASRLIPVALSASVQTLDIAQHSGGEDAQSQVEIRTPGGFMLRFSNEIGSGCLERLLSVVAHIDRGQRFHTGADRC